MSGTLHVVATPIGNLADITLRALDALGAARAICAEDTRRTKALLSHHAIPTPELIRLDAIAEAKHVARVLSLLDEGASVALVSDAGTPTISDPGSLLVRRARDAGHRIVPIPGASAVVVALSASGLVGAGGFRFFGFLPRSGSARAQAIRRLAETPESVVIFESGSRVQATLRDLANVQPERDAVVARELTKLHETFEAGTLQELTSREIDPRGEAVLVLGPWEPEESEAPQSSEVMSRIDAELASGAHPKTVAETVAAWSGRPKREIYALVVKRKHAGP